MRRRFHCYQFVPQVEFGEVVLLVRLAAVTTAHEYGRATVARHAVAALDCPRRRCLVTTDHRVGRACNRFLRDHLDRLVGPNNYTCSRHHAVLSPWLTPEGTAGVGG